MNSFSKICEIFVTVILFFIAPVFYMEYRSDLSLQLYVQSKTIYFVDSVRNVGYIDREMYEEFLEQLQLTGYAYDVQLMYYEQRQQFGTSGSYDTGYYTKDILDVLYSEVDQENSFEMYQGDNFTVKVCNKGNTKGGRMFEVLTNQALSFPEISVIYGGMIRSESI